MKSKFPFNQFCVGLNVWNIPHDVKLSGQHVINVTPKSSFTKVTMTVS